MEATYELINAARGVMQGSAASFWRLYELTLDDVYFQLHYTMASENDINPELEKVFITLAREFSLLDEPSNVMRWINDVVTRQLSNWIEVHREATLLAEKAGKYDPPVYQDNYLPALEAEDYVYTQALENMLCGFPELYRSMIIALYYDDYTVEEVADMLMLEKSVIAKRMEYIEKTLAIKMEEYCKENKIAKKPITAQKIRSALFEMQKLYRYPYAEVLFNNVRIKAIH